MLLACRARRELGHCAGSVARKESDAIVSGPGSRCSLLATGALADPKAWRGLAMMSGRAGVSFQPRAHQMSQPAPDPAHIEQDSKRQIVVLHPLRCVFTPQKGGGGQAGRVLSVEVESLSAFWLAAEPAKRRSPASCPKRSVPDPSLGLRVRGGAATADIRSVAVERSGPVPPAMPEPQSGGQGEEGFRRFPPTAALHAPDQEEEEDRVPEVSTPGWVLLGVLVSAVAVLLVVACFGRVEVTSTALGSLRVQSGPRPVLTQTSGTVSRLQVAAGELVVAGQPIAQLAAAHLIAQRSKLAEQLSLLEEGQTRARALSSGLHEHAVNALEQKRGILWRRIQLKQTHIARLEERSAEIGLLVSEGAASGTEALNSRSALDAAREELLLLRQQVADISIELADRKNVHGSELLTRELTVRESGVALSEANALAEMTIVSAPVSGRVESLLVSEGQVVPTGAVVARIVPDGEVTRAVVFVPSKDAAFVLEGVPANLEFPSLPVSDFGRARARVARVGSDVASAAEVAEVMEAPVALGDALVRVELVIEENTAWEGMAPRLRSGARVTARLMTRERRIIALAFDFVKHWLPQ